MITNQPSRKTGISNNSSENWCPVPTYISTAKSIKVAHYLVKMSFSSGAFLYKILQMDQTPARDVTPVSMMQIIYEDRPFPSSSPAPGSCLMIVAQLTPHVIHIGMCIGE